MALSNWATLAFGTDGKKSNGSLTTGEGVTVEIYKNWLYLSVGKDWEDRQKKFVHPTIAQINSGDIDIYGLHITAIRKAEREAIFVLVENTIYQEQISGEKYKPPIIHRMAGIGCSGYMSQIEALDKFFPEESKRILKLLGKDAWEEVEDLYACSGTDEDGDYCAFDFFDQDERRTIKLQVDIDSIEMWTGITDSLLKDFKEWLLSMKSKYNTEYNNWVESINWEAATNFNQGDAFFIGSEAAAVEVGTIQTPLLMQALKDLKDTEEDKNS